VVLVLVEKVWILAVLLTDSHIHKSTKSTDSDTYCCNYANVQQVTSQIQSPTRETSKDEPVFYRCALSLHSIPIQKVAVFE
jgi:hypothetical protein